MALCVLLFLLSVPPFLLYSLGYRWSPLFHLYKTGALYISSPVTGSKIFVNNKEEKQTNIFQGSLFLQSLKPGKYSILIARDDYWPWQKNLTVKEQMVTEARAILIPKEPKGEVVFWGNYSPLEVSKYYEIMANLKALKKPTYSRLTVNQKEKLWWDPKDNKVWVEWFGDKESLPYFFCDDKSCSDKILIFNSRSPIRNIDFYPKRKDAVIIAVQNGIFALEIDGRGGRNIQPIYKGKEPIFTIYQNESSIYILEEDKLIEIKL